MNRSEIIEAKRIFIKEREKILGKKISALENKIYDRVFDKVISELEISDGKIISNGKNINLTTAVDEIFKEIRSSEYFLIVKSMGKDFNGLLELNKSYFKILEDDQIKLDKITDDVSASMRKRIGLSPEGNIVKEGFLDKLLSDPTAQKKIKKEVLKGITQGKSFEEFRNDLKKTILGDTKVDGQLMRHFNTFAFDSYSQFNATTSKLYANKLGLTAFMYQGGLIKTSRHFCEARNGQVFTKDEIQDWENINFEGKTYPDYDPFIDRGGYNCRHQLNPISNSMAKRLRPDLENVLD